MLILLASYQKMFSMKNYLSDMKYDVKTSCITFLLIMSTEVYFSMIFKTKFIFVRPIIEQTKVHSKILELFVIMLGTRR